MHNFTIAILILLYSINYFQDTYYPTNDACDYEVQVYSMISSILLANNGIYLIFVSERLVQSYQEQHQAFFLLVSGTGEFNSLVLKALGITVNTLNPIDCLKNTASIIHQY